VHVRVEWKAGYWKIRPPGQAKVQTIYLSLEARRSHLGTTTGLDVGILLGASLGTADGVPVGGREGTVDGLLLGSAEGKVVGRCVGDLKKRHASSPRQPQCSERLP
jgi:outer membrane lipoprotein SlyB